MRTRTPKIRLTLIAMATGTVAFSPNLYASGFRVPELSTIGTGTSNAVIANTTELGALPYNPAGMSFHEGKGLVGGLTVVNYELSVDPEGGSPTDNIGDENFYIPNVYAMARGNGPWSFGLAVNAPFGLETHWPDETFPSFAGAADPLEPALSRILMVNINPNFAYRIDDSSSFAFGVDLYNVQDLRFNTQAVKISGKGSGIGFNLGYMKKLGALTLGLSYKSAVEADLKGSYDPSALGSNPSLATAKVEFPDMLQIGAHYQVNQAFGIEFDVERTGWSSFDSIEISHASAGLTSPTTSTNDWDDAWAYRLGAIYQLSPKTKLLFGYAYDETPQPDAHFSARVPDNDRQLFSVGATHDFGGWTLEGAFMYVTVDDRTVNSSDTFAGGDPNGTTAYNGEYENTVSLFSIGASMKF